MKPIQKDFRVDVVAEIQCHLHDVATGRRVRTFPKQKNLVLDSGLNALAQSTNAASTTSALTACRAGSDATSNSTASGAITFTQSGTTITASAGFFTAGMVGCIFKYGTGSGGAEYYITAFTDSTHVTVDTSATVSTPTVATVWFVQRNALLALIMTTGTYQTGAGDCGTSFSGSTVTHKRTFQFLPQAGSINVNEIGWTTNTSGTLINGRLVLGSTVVVPNTNFLVVVLSVSYTYSPASPTAVGNVGTNIDTSGTAAIEWLATGTVDSATGGNSTGAAGSGQGALDGANSLQQLKFITTSYSQNAGPANAQSGAPNPTLTTLFTTTQNWTYDGVRGRMKLVFNQSVSTTGQTFTGVTWVCSGTAGARPVFDILFTTPFVAPNGTFLPVTTFKITYNRVLTN